VNSLTHCNVTNSFCTVNGRQYVLNWHSNYNTASGTDMKTMPMQDLRFMYSWR
jgi:hypothetical protein